MMMTVPMSAPSRMETARMPGVGGTRPWVRVRPRLTKGATCCIPSFLRLARMAEMGAFRMMAMSPKTGMLMMKPVRDGASSRHLPLNFLMKKLTMLVAAPVSLMPEAMTAPKIIITPMEPKVEPKYLVMAAKVSTRVLPEARPQKVAVRNSTITGCILNFRVRTVRMMIAMVSMITKCRGDIMYSF